jgi:very-short-patch-repair endonuclease/DNA polymerase III delta prime subunit
MDRIHALVSDAIGKLRLKLLDLTNRNRLLNFKFSPTSKKFVRIIDEIPNILFEKLGSENNASRRLYFAALPEPPPPDTVDQTELALEGNDREPPDQTVGRTRRPRFDWRSRVDLPAWATGNGINPSFELAAASSGARRHEDNQIQTLLLPDSMEKKLSAIREDARLANEELGISTLFAAFGFLEWYEAETSDVTFFAPLLLLPVQIDRDLKDHRYRYFITGSDGAEPTYNVSLKERLKRDFGLDLPDLEEDDTPEAYAVRVSRAIRSKQRWKIHRYVVIGHFSFSRLVMYEDLAPERWPDNGLHKHEVIMTLLAGSSSESDDAHLPELDVDSDEVEKHVPVLITDADSSQFSAIVDAMKGRSFALKGPPGTGKSQTITNLIAAEMAAGRRVLFVAEKQAALEVVSKRLGEAGLAPFVLELHSTKSNKKRLLDSFEERLALSARRSDAELTETLRCLRETRQQLSSYVSVMNGSVGESGLSLHDVYWHEQGARRGLPADGLALARELERASSAMLSRHEHAQHLHLLDQLARSFLRGTTQRPLVGHPLFGIQRPGSGPDASTAVRGLLTAWAEAIERLERVLSRADGALRCAMPRTLEGLDGFLAGAQMLSAVPRDATPDLVARCDSAAGLEALTAIASQAGAVFDRWAEHRASANSLEFLLADLDGLIQSASSLVKEMAGLRIPDVRPEEVRTVLAGLTELLSQDQAMISFLGRFLEQSQQPALISGPHLSEWSDAIRLLKQVAPEVLHLRSEVLQRPDAASKLSKWSDEAVSLSAASAEVRGQVSLTLMESPGELRAAAAVLGKTNPALGLVMPSYRAAKKLYRSIAQGSWPSRDKASGELVSWAELIEKINRFESDPELRRYAGDAFSGLQTPFTRLLETVAFLAAVNTRWSLLDASRTLIAPLLAVGNAPLLEALRSGMPENAADRLRNLSGEMRGAGTRMVHEYLAERDGVIRQALSHAKALEEVDDLAAWPVKQSLAFLSGLRATVQAQDELRAGLQTQGWPVELPPTAVAVNELRNASTAARLIHEATIESDLRRVVLSKNLHVVLEAIKAFVPLIEQASAQVAERTNEVVEGVGVDFKAFLGGENHRSLALQEVEARLKIAIAAPEDDIEEWCLLRDAVQQCEEDGLAAISDALLDGRAPAANVVAIHRIAYLRGLIRWASQENSLLPRWTGDHIESLRAQLVKLDNEFISMSRKALKGRLCGASVPVGVRQGAAGDRTERALIEHEIGKQRRHIPIRDLLTRASQASRALKPCFMMSPASVAQFLPAGGAQFDVVIIDEASQMRPEEALGAIGRGRQAVIVGDPMQLPPTAFFDASTDTEEALAEEELDIDTESVLDLGLSSLRPARELRWHYRSRHHSLIAFSNREFYRDRLIVFPSPYPPRGHLGVQLVEVGEGIYGASVNIPEAEAVSNTVRDLIRRNPKASIGVVAVNQPQKEHLTELFDRLFAENDDLEEYRASWAGTLEPFFIKNLENVQGDERDVIVISTVYGRSAVGGPVYQRFGPINSKMGHRRLNVLFTRAKERVVVVTSLRPEDIQLQPGSSLGLCAFKNYLQFARSGRIESGKITGASADSPFEEEVAQELVQMGYSVEPQVGVAGFFIDLAVRHPVNKEHFLIGIECDGATYHSAKSARDRDRLREEILGRLGWKLYRIWSTDWFRARDREVARLKQHLDGCVRESSS